MYKFANNPKALEVNVVNWKDYRVTVLSDRLFRIEKSQDKKFVDKPTQGVFFRNMPKNEFSVCNDDNSLKIETQKVALVLKENIEDSRVILNGEEKPISNEGNLKGTYRTLDGYDGEYCIYQGQEGKKITLADGVCSTTGVAVVDDTSSFIVGENGVLAKTTDQMDIYVFAYGNDYVGAVKAFYMIEGKVPAVPRYVFGNWWSRYFDYTENSYLALLNKFEENKIPLSVATIDMDWHYSDNVDKQKKITESGKNSPDMIGEGRGNIGWTGYSWNKEFFPDPPRFLSEVKKKNLAITLNLHPSDGVRWWEDCYGQFADAMGVDKTTNKQIQFDITDPKFVKNYFKILHHPQEKMGVDFWWIDWQQGTKTAIEGLDPLWLLNHYHYLDNQKRHGEGVILSRYSGAGAHRYPLGFSGDTSITWDTLHYLPKFTATSSNVGYTLWSHDIGGHHMGERDEELFVRAIQYGVFSPINRLHSTKQSYISKEPWNYLNGGGEIVKEYLRLRHQLVPYIYSEVTENVVNGTPWIQPLYYHYPDKKEAYECANEYFFGSQLLVAPITKKSKEDMKGWGSVKVYIPKGTWTDIFTGEKYTEGKQTLLRPLQSIPVLIKEGGILPLAQKSFDNGCDIPKCLIVKAYKGNGGYDLKESGDGKSGIKFTSEYADGKQIIRVKGYGKTAVKNRSLRIDFADIDSLDVKNEKLFVGGKARTVNVYQSDNASVLIENFANGKEYVVSVEVKEKTKLQYLKDMALKMMVAVNGNNPKKFYIYSAIQNAQTDKEIVDYFKNNKEIKAMPPYKEKMEEIAKVKM